MIIRDITPADKAAFNAKAGHPLQSYEWGEFRAKSGLTVIRKGVFEGKRLILPIQVTLHPLPGGYNLGYFPRGPMPDETQLKTLKSIGKENHCLLIKLEPNVSSKVEQEQVTTHAWREIDQFLKTRGLKSGRPLFTRHTFQLDLTQSEDKLLGSFHPKTRYNIRLAERKGVKIIADNSDNAFGWFIKLLFEETISRQGFYAHTPAYFKTMWQTLKDSGMLQLLRAEHEGKVLAIFMAFNFNGVLYYPYGASTREAKNVMAPNLLMWELIKFGKDKGCKLLDMWGALGPNPDPKDPWYGFHRFKAGYGAQLTEFLGTYDLVLDPALYPVYRVADSLRWGALRIKAKLKQWRLI